MRLKLKDASGNLLSENFYWRGNTPLSYGALATLPSVNPSAYSSSIDDGTTTRVRVTIQNSGEGVAAAARLKLVRRQSGARVLPVFYDANYFFLMPHETKTVSFEFRDSGLAGETPQLMLEGLNITPMEVPLGSGPDLVLKKSASASSSENTNLAPENVLDGSASTRWSSSYSDPQWITVDLGSAQGINRVRLKWESAYGKSYEIRVSSDGAAWTTVYRTTDGHGGLDDIVFKPVNARYVQMYGTQRATIFGYSLYEFEVYAPTYKLASTPLAEF